MTVTADITNTGSRAGADVAQAHVGDPAATGAPPPRPPGVQRRLVGTEHGDAIEPPVTTAPFREVSPDQSCRGCSILVFPRELLGAHILRHGVVHQRLRGSSSRTVRWCSR
ncbi:hypothetical protein DXZ75_25180 [Streptomyces sp. AcE210]|nr:hypothetical protein DXZ75_25180 [Streptomyces sp. AcE210]